MSDRLLEILLLKELEATATQASEAKWVATLLSVTIEVSIDVTSFEMDLRKEGAESSLTDRALRNVAVLDRVTDGTAMMMRARK